MINRSRISLALLAVFVVSGFAGLLYQSVWSHYLGLSLGHAAYAQTLVLAMFMGGMALGAWLASRYSTRVRRLILTYALIEAVIGVLGLVFHPAFGWYTTISQDVILPALGDPALAHAWQWLSAALIIAPQSVLLGATFPLMSAGLIRALPQEQGEVLGGLYFTNSLGAALGALVATFALLPAVGLPGTVMTAGLLNILVAIAAWALAKSLIEENSLSIQEDSITSKESIGSESGLTDRSDGQAVRLGRVLLWSTALSGAASFIYEIGWVRLLNQAFGTTIHSFELMLAAFILGLAFGGLWIRKRARHILEPVRYVGYVQVWMGVAALLSLPVFAQSFHWVGWMMSALSRTDNGYALYELATALIALAVMFPAAFLAGMTLPLFTVALMRGGGGERAIGGIYAANTVGAIVGVAFMTHLLIPSIGVHLAIVLGALLDGAVGLYLLRAVNPARLTVPVGGAAFLLVIAVGVAVVGGRPASEVQMSGVFRTGQSRIASINVEYLRDGKTATVGVFNHSGRRVIATNGKPDAGMSNMTEAPASDEITMVMLGALPLVLHPSPEEVAFIGWGSGLSTHTLLGSPVPQVVDTIEIEPVMHEAARRFGKRVERAYTDSRSNLRVDDARTFFSTGARTYDVIVSEPSNPWVSGVASLFTHEFYAFLRKHLKEDGMLVQWLHTYELNDQLLAAMVAALLEEFPGAEVYLTNTADLVIVARKDGSLSPPPTGAFAAPGTALASELARVGFDRPEQLALRRIGGPEVLQTFVRMTGASPHSDFYPLVSLQAPKARFNNNSATTLTALAVAGLPVLDILDCRTPVPLSAKLTPSDESALSQWREMAAAANRLNIEGPTREAAEKVAPRVLDAFLALQSLSVLLADQPGLMNSWSDSVAALAIGTIGHLHPDDLLAAWSSPKWMDSALAADPAVQSIVSAYSAAAARDSSAMLVDAVAALEATGPDGSRMLREQMLVIALLGALGTGQPDLVPQLEARWGATVGNTADLTLVRAYLAAWADGGAPSCVASSTFPN